VTETPLTFWACCHICNEIAGVVRVEGPNWWAAAMWCYVAQKEHERKVHGAPDLPETVRPRRRGH
jgi:hypothetical protein